MTDETSRAIGEYCSDLPDRERWPELGQLLNQLVQLRQLPEASEAPACEFLPTVTVHR
jgi:hypothetical protein